MREKPMYVNLSAAPVALVTPFPVTVTSTVPTPGGEVAVIVVADVTVTAGAAVVPNFTVSPVAKLVPVILISVPPAALPEVGVIDVTEGGVGTYVNLSAAPVALVTPFPVTVTSTVPTPGGEVAVIVVADVTVTAGAAVVPNFTVSPVAKLVPVILTAIPPAALPEVGVRAVTAGCGMSEKIAAVAV